MNLSRLPLVLPGLVVVAVVWWVVAALVFDIPGPSGEVVVAAVTGPTLVHFGVRLLRLPISWRTHATPLGFYAAVCLLWIVMVGVLWTPRSPLAVALAAFGANLLVLWLAASLRQPVCTCGTPSRQ